VEQDVLRRKYRIDLHTEKATGGRIVRVARHPDLPGCIGYGDTSAEAKASLEKSREAYLQLLIARGAEIPEPSTGADEIEWMPPETVQPSYGEEEVAAAGGM
jgi:predicted RNase H-like HicB family nuclease